MHLDQNLLDVVLGALFMGALGMVAYFSKRFFKRLDDQDVALNEIKSGATETRVSLAEIKVVLGVNTENGIRGTVRQLDERVRQLEKAT